MHNSLLDEDLPIRVLENITNNKLKQESAKDLAIILGIIMNERRRLNKPWWKRWLGF